jgi:cation diffusion facilitator family transporter
MPSPSFVPDPCLLGIRDLRVYTGQMESVGVTVSPPGPQQSGSLVTVIVALSANALLALVKSVAALATGSASMVAEAAHSWADAGNECFLLIAERSGRRPRDTEHPRGYGRATYIWSLVAAFGLFSAGAMFSVYHGISQLSGSSTKGNFTVSYVVLGIAFLLESMSFLQATRQVRSDAREFGLHPLRYLNHTSDPTVRAVFLEDFSALLGLLIAGTAIAAHQVTGDPAFDALGSIGVGALLAVVAVFLMRRNMEYLLGEGLSPEQRSRVLSTLLAHPEIERITYLHAEYVGPQLLFVVAAVDLTGDDTEGPLALRFQRLEADIEKDPMIADAVLTMAPPGEPELRP